MVETFQFDLVAPERHLATLQVHAVQIPASEGEMTAMPGHAATITTLRPGVVRAEAPDGTTAYLVTGGFADVTAQNVSVLAEVALPLAEVTDTFMDDLIAQATAKRDAATGLEHSAAELYLADLQSARTSISAT